MNSGVMIYVDGSNLLSSIGRTIGANIDSAKPTNDEMSLALTVLNGLWPRLQGDSMTGAHGLKILRRHWFGSYYGDTSSEYERKSYLRNCDYEPILFKKEGRNSKEKRVDIAICREMLISAFNKQYSHAYLITGDEDFVDLVADVKKLGIRVTGCAFPKSTSKDFRLVCDNFHELAVWGNGYEKLVANILQTTKKS